MSWQDELAQLDSALASGQISADEYRTRRDRVIAQASGQSAPDQPQQQAAEPTAVFRPVQPPQQQGFESGDHTQIVSGRTTGEHTQVVGAADADSTQIVPNTQAQQQRPHFPPPQPPPPWESQQPHPQAMTPPPWANEDLPPEFGQQSWPRQGPEVFEEKSRGGAGKVAGIIVAVVVVLALAGGAIWFFGFKDSGGNQANNPTSEQSKPKTTKPKPPPPDIPEGPFLDLPGAKVYNRTVPIAQAVADEVPTKPEAQLLQSVGVSEVSGLVTDVESGVRTGLWAFKIGETANPAAVLTAIDQHYQAAKYELLSNENGVKVRRLPASKPDEDTAYRAHYLTDDGYLVRVEVYGKDSANVEATFNELLPEQTDKFPPAP
ncbi:MAG: SHOCT domain-containing protein [Actinophytocola sp.]|uniref:SHOCT domain-containing protein n=1 Tax=Actinophytocola sp. TaxID=1872138 RepID=UPI003C771580